MRLDYASMKLTMNEQAIVSPTSFGLTALDPRSSAFRNGPSWEEFERAQKGKGLGDWQVIWNLNQEAELLWSELMACNGHDPERVRAGYYRAQPCLIDSAQSPVLKEKLTVFHRRFDDFLSTTQFLIPKASKRNTPWDTTKPFAKILYDFSRSVQGLPSDYDHPDPAVQAYLASRQVKFPELHPLLTQLMIEALTNLNRLTRAGYQSLYSDKTQKPDDPVVLDYPHHSYLNGLRPTELALWNELSARNLLDLPDTYRTARAFGNVWYLYSVVAKEKCDQLGLWPEFSYAAIHTLRDQNVEAAREIVRAIEDADCSRARPTLEQAWKNEPIRLNDRDLVLFQRQMGIRYGFRPLDRVACPSDLKQKIQAQMWGISDRYRCYTVDPSAPHDIEDGKDWARGNFSNPRAVRAKQSYEFISAK